MMLNIGEHCKIEMIDPTEPNSILFVYGTVVEFQFPLVKLNLDDREGVKIFNLTASVIISVKP
jgi:hypothetical protein